MKTTYRIQMRKSEQIDIYIERETYIQREREIYRIYKKIGKQKIKPGGGRDNQRDPQRHKKDLAVYQQNCHCSKKREIK